MAVKTMKIQFRMGKEADLLADRILPGEPVYANDTNKVGIGTALGTIVWFATMNPETGKLNQMPTANDIGAIANALKGVANGIATLNSGGKIEQDPASYGKARGAALISALPESAVLVKLNPDGTLSEAAKNTDYVNMETGAFTPFLKGSTTAGSFTYYYQVGQYTKIGNMVFVQLYIKINTIPTAANGNLILAGLPFGTGNGYAGFPNIVGKIGGKDFVGVVDITNGLVFGANCIGHVDASTLVTADGFCCSISYPCEP